MNTVNALHHQAMEFVDQAMLEQRAGNQESAIKLFERATEYELAAIDSMSEPAEPTYSVLHRSAASMAMNANQLRQAERIINKALAQNPHPEIADEMRELLERIYFQWNLERNSATMARGCLELSLAGPSVGYGIVHSKELIRRINSTIEMITRTAERTLKIPFRESGQANKDVREYYQPWISALRAGSFGVVINFISTKGQMSFPEMVGVSEVIDEFMTLMEFLDKSGISEIQERIPDQAYLTNFLSLAKKVAPDGKEIQKVGFTSIGDHGHRSVIISKVASDLPLPPPTEPAFIEPEPVEILGTLRFADATSNDHNNIKIVDGNGKSHNIRVLPGMMDDIVRPMWGRLVTVNGVRAGTVIELQEVKEAEELEA